MDGGSFCVKFLNLSQQKGIHHYKLMQVPNRCRMANNSVWFEVQLEKMSGWSNVFGLLLQFTQKILYTIKLLH